MGMAQSYDNNVFVNCPFDSAFQELFDAIIFTIQDCGFLPRCTLEASDSGETRIEKIYRLISESRYSIHDISRTELDPEHGLPRFNMPLELGVVLGAKQFGRGRQRSKECLILDSQPNRYDVFCSDISGQEVEAHHDNAEMVIELVRNWFRKKLVGGTLPGPKKIVEHFNAFKRELPRICEDLGFGSTDELTYKTYNDFTFIVDKFLSDRYRQNPAG